MVSVPWVSDRVDLPYPQVKIALGLLVFAVR